MRYLISSGRGKRAKEDIRIDFLHSSAIIIVPITRVSGSTYVQIEEQESTSGNSVIVNLSWVLTLDFPSNIEFVWLGVKTGPHFSDKHSCIEGRAISIQPEDKTSLLLTRQLFDFQLQMQDKHDQVEVLNDKGETLS